MFSLLLQYFLSYLNTVCALTLKITELAQLLTCENTKVCCLNKGKMSNKS